MTTLTDDVMNDLLTVYLAGEASPATREIVEARAASDPAFAERLNAAQLAVEALVPLPEPPPDSELTALRQTRRLLFLRTTCVAWGVLFTLLPLLFTFDGSGIHPVFWGRHPALVISFWSLAVASWVAAFLMHRGVRSSGL